MSTRPMSTIGHGVLEVTGCKGITCPGDLRDLIAKVRASLDMTDDRPARSMPPCLPRRDHTEPPLSERA
jgi:hypothetical protein